VQHQYRWSSKSRRQPGSVGLNFSLVTAVLSLELTLAKSSDNSQQLHS
jgi:hypothetical protein